LANITDRTIKMRDGMLEHPIWVHLTKKEKYA
jgi:hypothetical protein